MTKPMMKAKVFNKDGNRFLVPGIWYDTTDTDAEPTEVAFNAMTFGVVLGAEVESDWLDIDPHADFPNLPYRIVGPQLAHGAMDVVMIGGPLFDAATATPA